MLVDSAIISEGRIFEFYCQEHFNFPCLLHKNKLKIWLKKMKVPLELFSEIRFDLDSIRMNVDCDLHNVYEMVAEMIT